MNKWIIAMLISIFIILIVLIYIGFTIEPIECPYNMTTLECWQWHISGKG